MCIRDRRLTPSEGLTLQALADAKKLPVDWLREKFRLSDACLLYTSDAADERSSVDLGGRRIIKKKKKNDKKQEKKKKKHKQYNKR